jgi:hypothetical protein
MHESDRSGMLWDATLLDIKVRAQDDFTLPHGDGTNHSIPYAQAGLHSILFPDLTIHFFEGPSSKTSG